MSFVSAMAAAVPLTSAVVPLFAAAAVSVACHLTDPAIAESSGAARAPEPAWIYTHNDSGDGARFFAVDRTCRTIGTWRLRSVAAVDWEDMATGPGATLWFGDIGDNRSSRDHVSLYRVDGASLPASGATVASTRVDLRYDDGPHDAETLLVHPTDGRVWVVTKSLDGEAGVYAADLGAGTLHRVAALDLDLGGATGGDISPDGGKVVIRTYLAAYEWRVTGGDVVGALTSGRSASTALVTSEQGEGIAYVDDDSLVTTAEGDGAAVRTFASQVVDDPSTTASLAPSPGATRPPCDGGGDDPPWWVLGAGGAALAVVVGALVARARRRGE
jgi:hypothetical protein